MEFLKIEAKLKVSGIPAAQSNFLLIKIQELCLWAIVPILQISCAIFHPHHCEQAQDIETQEQPFFICFHLPIYLLKFVLCAPQAFIVSSLSIQDTSKINSLT